MKQAWQLVHQVQEKYRGLAVRLHAMNGKTAEWYSSHGREPRSENPMSSGNVSEVEHYMRYVRKYEGANRGAGRMLSGLVYNELSSEFAQRDREEINQCDLELEVIDESTDVQKWLVRCDIESASRMQLIEFETQCDEALDAISRSKSQARARRREIEMERDRAAADPLREFAAEKVGARRNGK